MSLDFDLSRIPNRRELCQLERDGKTIVHPVTEALIFASLFVRLGEITAGNVEEWDVRLRAMEGLDITMLNEDDDAAPGGRRRFNPSRADVEAHIGLRINVPSISRARFKSECGRICLERAVEKARAARERSAA